MSAQLVTKQTSRLEGPNHGRDLGRRHSSPVDNNYFRPPRTTVARKSSRRGSQPDRYVPPEYIRDQVSFRGPPQSKVIEQRRHTLREPSQLSQSPLEKPPPTGPSLDRRSKNQVGFRKTRTEVNRPGVNLKNGQRSDQTRWARGDNLEVMEDDRTFSSMDRQTRRRAENSCSRERILDSSAREPTRRDDSTPSPISRSAAITDELDLMMRDRPSNQSFAKTAQSLARLNGAPEINSDYPSCSPKDQYAIGNRHQPFSASRQSESQVLNPHMHHASPPGLRLAPLSLHNTSSDDGSIGSAALGKLTNGNDAITPVSTSAMSISSGSTPPQSISCSSSKNSRRRERNACIVCKKPEAPIIDRLVRCSQCQAQYHTSCHNPKITCTKGNIDVNVETWKCQRCINRSGYSLQVTEISTSMAKPSHSAASEHSSMSSENSTTQQISQAITDLTLSGRESESASGASPRFDRHYNSRAQYPMRRSERLQGNLHGSADISPRCGDDTSDPDFGHPRKRFKRDIPGTGDHHTEERQTRAAERHRELQGMQQIYQNENPQLVTIPSTSGKIFERLEQNRNDEISSRSPSIFSENRMLAVVIDNRSRSTSTSTNDKNVYHETNNWFQTPTTVKDSQETPTLIRRAHYETSSQNQPPPSSYQDSQPIVIGSDEDEILTPPRRARQVLPLEVKNSQENEGELTDAPMSLDSPEVYSPHPQDYNMFNHLNCDNMAPAICEHTEPQWRPYEEGTFYAGLGRLSVHTSPDTQFAKESPRYPPSVGDPYGKDMNGRREHRDSSSPPYSPPPPDVPETLPEPSNRAESYIPLPQMTIQDQQSHDDEFVCRVCGFLVQNHGQYKDKLCGSCAVKATAPRNNYQIPETSISSSKMNEPAKSAQPSPLTSHPRFRAQHRNSVFTKSSSPKAPDSDNRSGAAKKGETSKTLGSGQSSQIQIVTPVKKFQTSKDRVIERYSMTFHEPELQGNANPSIPATNLTNLSKRKREEPARLAPRRRISISEALERGKGKTTIFIGKPAKSTSSSGPARKFPSKPTPISSPPSVRTPNHICTDRPTPRGGSIPSKKTERRGPAIKNAGRISVSISDSDGDDSDDNDDDNEDRSKELEQKLREQKGYTKKQMEKAVEFQRKFIQSEKEKIEQAAEFQRRSMQLEKEKNDILEKLEAALAANQKPVALLPPEQSRKVKKLKRLIQPNRTGKADTNDQLVKPTANDRTNERRKVPSSKEFYKDYKFTANNPWSYPVSELPAPDPSTFRSQSWHKTPYRPWEDKAKLMSVHVHRQLTRDRGPINIMVEPYLDSKSSYIGPAGGSRSASLNDEPDDDFRWPRGGIMTTFDAYMEIPDNMVPSVKDGFLGFRAGILSHRTRRLDRTGTHHKIRIPGVLMDKN